MKTKPKPIKFRVDLFAYTLMTMTFGWVLMSGLRGFEYNHFVQAGIVMLASLMWALYATLALHFYKKHAAKQMLGALEADKKFGA